MKVRYCNKIGYILCRNKPGYFRICVWFPNQKDGSGAYGRGLWGFSDTSLLKEV